MRVAQPVLSSALVLLASTLPLSADWSTYQADAARSAVCQSKLDFPLRLAWEYTPVQSPAPAWPEPGKELHRLDFDYAHQPILVDGKVFFGSTSDDAVRALDSRTGKLLWRRTLGGPVRFAPAYADERLHVVSDDGFVYCLDPADGALVWKFRVAPGNDMLLGNGRMISRWPVRSGPVVDDGVLYIAAGMWPAQGIHLYALDAASGTVRWHNDRSGSMYMDLPHPTAAGFSGVCPQGYLLIEGDDLIVPTGRSIPAVFDKTTGELRYYTPAVYRANGGYWVTAANGMMFNQRHGSGPDIDVRRGEAAPAHDDGMAAYLLQTGEIALDATGMHRVIVDGDTMYATGSGRARAFDMKKWTSVPADLDAATIWSAPHGRTYCMVKAGHTLLLGGQNTITAVDANTGKRIWHDSLSAQVRGCVVDKGMVVVALRDGRLAGYMHHTVEVPVIAATDTVAAAPAVHGREVDLAARVVQRSGVTKGYALLVGKEAVGLSAALALRTDLNTVVLLPDSASLHDAQQWLTGCALLGRRVWCTAAKDTSLPFSPYFADLVVVNKEASGIDVRELYRVLRPCGGVLLMPGLPGKQVKKLLKAAAIPKAEIVSAGDEVLVRRGALAGAGEWRCQWADAGRSRVGSESRVRSPLDLLWFGEPGPELMMSRHWGTSTPLAVSGRMFVTGQNHVMAYNAYNGTTLWTVELPGAGRKSTRWRSANFVADDRSLFVTVGTTCLQLDQATGQTIGAYTVPHDARVGDVARARKPTHESVEVNWPTEWFVAGPMPKGTKALAPEHFSRIPKRLTVSDKDYPLRSLRTVDGWLDLTYLYGGYGFDPLKPGEKPEDTPRGTPVWDNDAAMRVAFAFAKVSCPTAGTLTIGAGADWWMRWYIDGKEVYSTWPSGNERKPFAITNHVFQVEVDTGEHVVAVMLQAGSEGWRMVSAAGARYQMYWEMFEPDAPERGWGCVALTDELILGTYAVNVDWYSQSKSVFAIERATGTTRWLYRSNRCISDQSLAIGGGQVYIAEGPAEDKLSRFVGHEGDSTTTLAALRLHDGSVAWRTKGFVRTVRTDAPDVQHVKGMVLVDGVRAYGAVDGGLRWQQDEPDPQAGEAVVHGERVVLGRNGYRLADGQPVTVTDPVSGRERQWSYARSYGCGPVVGCRDMLLFRSGAAGMYDFSKDGTTTFGGVRAGCAVSLVPAHGLVNAPEAASGCVCSYNFQTSYALVPSARVSQQWYVFGGPLEGEPVRHLYLNLGAPGDSRDSAGVAWLAVPHPVAQSALTVPVTVAAAGDGPQWRHSPSLAGETSGVRPWIHTSGVAGRASVFVQLRSADRVAIPRTGEPPRVDGVLDDSCWNQAVSLPFMHFAHMASPVTEVFARRDSSHVYFAYRRIAATRKGAPVPFTATQAGRDVRSWLDDGVEVFLTDTTEAVGMYFGVFAGGGTVDGKADLANGKGADLKWNGAWSHAVKVEGARLCAEMAVPVATLREMGIDVNCLAVNVRSQNKSGIGASDITLTPRKGRYFSLCKGFLPVGESVATGDEAAYTVRAHVASLRSGGSGKRALRVAVRGSGLAEDVELEAVDAVVKEFRGVKAASHLCVDIEPLAGVEPATLCALEVLAE